MENNRTETADMIAAGVAIAAAANPFPVGSAPFIIVPEKYEAKNLESLLFHPIRKRGEVSVTDSAGFVAYMMIHSGEGGALVYADIDQTAGSFKLVGVINDNSTDKAGWRDHTCTMNRRRSVEWDRWTAKNKSPMAQSEFATWIEDNLSDIAAVEGMPTGSDMLAMSLGFERTSEKRLKSKINLQSGSVRLEYIDDEDKDTRTSMEVFSRFSIGIPVFENSTAAYQIDARLKYRESAGKVSFWFELIRADKAFRQAVNEEVDVIGKATGIVIINGKPVAAK